ncbi:jg2604 [Pararge aegeria aegeria]|uniref:Jg2604 protein n=1 Tax=Pararge aegeria aegeria TaxID=348720 RepID=A0A8S4R510_9NEOP|nr:jg2604 [Pararge aegeria aegeria]
MADKEKKMERLKNRLIKLHDKIQDRVEDFQDQMQTKIEAKISRLVAHLSEDRTEVRVLEGGTLGSTSSKSPPMSSSPGALLMASSRARPALHAVATNQEIIGKPSEIRPRAGSLPPGTNHDLPTNINTCSVLLERIGNRFPSIIRKGDRIHRYLLKNTRLSDVNKRLKAQIWSSVVTIVLVEAKNLPAMDVETRSSDPYCKFR